MDNKFNKAFGHIYGADAFKDMEPYQQEAWLKSKELLENAGVKAKNAFVEAHKLAMRGSVIGDRAVSRYAEIARNSAERMSNMIAERNALVRAGQRYNALHSGVLGRLNDPNFALGAGSAIGAGLLGSMLGDIVDNNQQNAQAVYEYLNSKPEENPTYLGD